MRLNIKKHFLFKKKDRIGILILFSILIILLIMNLLIPIFTQNKNNYDYKEFSAKVDSFMVSLEPIETEYVSKLDSYIIARYDTLELFKFNPNTTNDAEWLKLGLTEKQIKTINNYRNKGGRFTIKDDFKKIYGIRTKQYQILQPYIDLPEKETKKHKQKVYNNKKQNNKTRNLVEFDPNTATDKIFEDLGLTKKQIASINKYRTKGGKFYKKEDFKKMYVISEKEYEILAPYIIIKKEEKPNKKSTVKIPTVDINTADTAILKKLPGIGPTYSTRIVNYRNKLGGFIKIEQISEVYGIKPETYNKIKPYLTISKIQVKKININFSEYKDLVKHPYINSKTANKILKYKKANGFYSSVEILLQKNIIDEKIYNKLKFYLTV